MKDVIFIFFLAFSVDPFPDHCQTHGQAVPFRRLAAPGRHAVHTTYLAAGDYRSSSSIHFGSFPHSGLPLHTPFPPPPAHLNCCKDFWGELPTAIHQQLLDVSLNDATNYIEKEQTPADLTARRLAEEEHIKTTSALHRQQEEILSATSDAEKAIAALKRSLRGSKLRLSSLPSPLLRENKTTSIVVKKQAAA